jgi:hypothetical protein
MKAIKIDKGIPIPKQGRGRPSVFPFEDMEIGDSIFVPVKEAKDKSRAIGRAAMYARTHGVRFKTRTVEGGIRIWLIASSAKKPAALEAA